MCGIAGGVALRAGGRPDVDRVKRMMEAIAHRGPDGEGLWISPSGAACFGHRRLSIIDLALGKQPIISPDGHHALTFNGELYNYIELRPELERRGVQFTTNSDTEVLLQSLSLDGAAALHSTVGMYGFAYWDDHKHELLLVRDRVGKKPLYYVVDGECIYFCSTLNGLLIDQPTPELNATATANFLDLGYVPGPETIYEGVWKLSAASYLSVSHDEPAPREVRYWWPARDIGSGVQQSNGVGGVDEVASLIENAVAIRLRSDVPLGVFLSGGIDSSLVTALACKERPGEIATYTIGFDVPDLDESQRAKRVADHLGTHHTEFRLSPDILGILPNLLHHAGEPFADAAALPLWVLAERARETITVALLGDGGDEGFAGYDWYRTGQQLTALDPWGHSPVVAGLAHGIGALLPRRAGRLLHLLTTEPGARLGEMRCQFGRWSGANVFAQNFHRHIDPARHARHRLQQLYHEARMSPVHSMQYADIRLYLAEGLLPKVDIATMAHGLEARAPLLDHRVLDLSLSMHPSHTNGRGGKAMLRDILRRYVPQSLTDGPKRGFTVPLAQWFRGELSGEIEGLISGSLMDTGWFDRPGMESVIADHQSGRRDNSGRLFHLMVLNRWIDL